MGNLSFWGGQTLNRTTLGDILATAQQLFANTLRTVRRMRANPDEGVVSLFGRVQSFCDVV